jgi:hypothetical protein
MFEVWNSIVECVNGSGKSITVYHVGAYVFSYNIYKFDENSTCPSPSTSKL